MRFRERRALKIELAAVCAGAVALLGLMLAIQVHADAQRGETAAAVHRAQVAAGPLISSGLKRHGDGGPVLAIDAQRAFDALVARAREQAPIDRVIVRDGSGRIVFADDHRLIGKRVGATRVAATAVDGVTDYHGLKAAERPPFSTGDRETAVWFPLRVGSDTPTHSLELWVRQSAIDHAVGARAHSLYGILFLFLAALAVSLTAVAQRVVLRLLDRLHDREERAATDPLTGLGNRTRFRDALEAALGAGRKATGAVVLMDLDRFKDVNDTLGHHNGDLLLQRIGSRLRTVLGGDAIIARLGGDEFAITVPGPSDRQSVAPLAQRILKLLEEPVAVGGVALSADASLGIALYPEHGGTVDDLLRAADVAMYIAKERRSGHEFYDPEAHAGRHDAGRLALIGELRRAMDEAELVLHYQPAIDLRTGRASGVEALARWCHPERGILLPAEFIPLAERSNQLRQMTLFLIDAALEQCAAWHRSGIEIRVAVNIAARNMLDLQFPADLTRLVEAWALPPGTLELELTESTIMSDPRRARVVLARIRELGVRVAIDDFGTGYSSLAHLQDLAVDSIKMDRSFVSTMDTDGGNAKIVESTVELAHGLGLEIVAEGVETLEGFTRLTELGCDYAQGYFLSRPLDAQRATIWLETMGGFARKAAAPLPITPEQAAGGRAEVVSA